MRILALDPGESTGWVTNKNGTITGGTITHDRQAVWRLLLSEDWDVIVFETFQLYASHARTLIGNKFYTCEIIGLIKLVADMTYIQLVEQGASVKKYSGAYVRDEPWQLLKKQKGATEHTWDAYQHYCYYMRTRSPKDRARQDL